MKKSLYILFVVIAALTICSCNKKNIESENSFVREEYELPPEMRIGGKRDVPQIERTVTEVEKIEIVENPEDPSAAFENIVKMDKAPEHLTEEYLIRRWDVYIISSGIHSFSLLFGQDGHYRIISPHSGRTTGDYGNYEIQDNKVIIHELKNLKSSHYEDLIPRGESLILEYDYNYQDNYEVGVLKNETYICRSHVESKEYGSIGLINNFEVEKIKPIYLVPTENMKLREIPDLSGNEMKFHYSEYFWITILKEVNEENLIPVDIHPTNRMDCLLKGMVVESLFRTTKQDTIDGITAPWYHLYLEPLEIGEDPLQKDYWVFGGYMEIIGEEITDEETLKYKNVLIQEGLKRQYLVRKTD